MFPRMFEAAALDGILVPQTERENLAMWTGAGFSKLSQSLVRCALLSRLGRRDDQLWELPAEDLQPVGPQGIGPWPALHPLNRPGFSGDSDVFGRVPLLANCASRSS